MTVRYAKNAVIGSNEVVDGVRATGPFVVVNSSTVLSDSDSGKSYGAIPGGGDDPIIFSLPTSGATLGLRFLVFNAAGKSVQLLCGGAETILLKTSGANPAKVQIDENLGWLEIVSTGLGSWVIVSGSGKWFDADTPAKYHQFDGDVHDGTDLICEVYTGSRVTHHTAPFELTDDEAFNMPNASAGRGWVMAGDDEEYADFRWTSGAVVTIFNNSANAVNTDTDGKLCVFDNGTRVSIRNRLGATKKILFDYHYTTP